MTGIPPLKSIINIAEKHTFVGLDEEGRVWVLEYNPDTQVLSFIPYEVEDTPCT